MTIVDGLKPEAPSAAVRRAVSRRGWINGFIGMVLFSGSLPATRLAVAALDPLFLTVARASIAGLFALVILSVRPQRRPSGGDVRSLALVATCCVIVFPLLTALALREMNSADGLVFVGLLPLATAAAACLRGETRPRWVFWAFATAGSTLVAVFAMSRGGRVHGLGAVQMLAAIAVCGLGYAEGGRLARRLGGWQVISWALVLALPITLPATLMDHPLNLAGVSPAALAGLGYVSVFSMLIGFVFWYDGLAHGGTAAVGQLQLLQPFFGLVGAGLVLGEPVGWTPIAMLVGVMACAAGARRYA